MACDEAQPANPSRRGMLRWMALGVAGAVIALLGAESILSQSSMVGNPFAPSVKVKVVYLQMPQFISANQEYFVLQSPAYFGDLTKVIFDKYPILSTMDQNMAILLDGTSASPATALKDGDEVDFIPMMVGG